MATFKVGYCRLMTALASMRCIDYGSCCQLIVPILVSCIRVCILEHNLEIIVCEHVFLRKNPGDTDFVGIESSVEVDLSIW